MLQALYEGPGHGSALAQRVRDRSGDQIRLGHGGVYAALTQVPARGPICGWTVAPGRRRARARATDLRAHSQGGSTLRSVSGAPCVEWRVSPHGPDPVRDGGDAERLGEASELSAAVLSLRDAMPR